MGSENTDRRTDSSEATTGGLGFERRPLLKALSAGATLSLGSGLTAASENESDTNESDSADAPADDADEIDPLYGYATPTADELPAEMEPDHEVQMRVAPPAEDRPALFYFEPSGLHVDPGDIVQFTANTPDHTVTPYHPGHGFQQRVPENVPPFSSPVVSAGGAWLYQFEQEGVYDLYCGPHHVLGMVIRVVVGQLDEQSIPAYADTFEGSEDPPLEAPFSAAFLERELNEFSEHNEGCEWVWLTPEQVLSTTALEPMNVQNGGEVPFGAVAEELGYELGQEEMAPPTVQIGTHPEHGEILVGPEGMTLYMFDSDAQGEAASTCQDDCAEAWPPFTVEEDPTAGEGVTAELATFQRETGGTQVMANGWPLYYFAQDEEPGDVNGQGVNDVWWVLGPDGTPIRSDSSE